MVRVLRGIGTILTMLMFSSFLEGQANVSTSLVKYASGNDTVSAYLNVPSGQGAYPAIIVIHEWWGLNDWVKENAIRLAKRGYITLAIDLYRGRTAQTPEVAHELMRGLPEDRAVRDLQAAVAFLKSRSDVHQKKIASVGWCMGGGYSLTSALNTPDLAACVICYGRLATDSSLVAKISCPILGIFGDQDAGITPGDVEAFETLVQRMGKKIEVKEYHDAGHAFMNPNNTNGFRKSDAEDAWVRIVNFLDNNLKISQR